MSSMLVSPEALASGSFHLRLTQEEIRNLLSSLQSLQYRPFTMDASMRYEVGAMIQAVERLQAQLQRIDNFVKESGDAYGTLERTLTKNAQDLNETRQKSVHSQRQRRITSSLHATASIKKKALLKKTEHIQSTSQYNRWRVYPMDTYADVSHQGISGRNLRSLITQGVGASLEAGAHLVRVNRTDRLGDNLTGKAEFGVGNAELSGKVHGVLFQDKKLDPELDAEVGACVSALSGLVSLNWRNELAAAKLEAKGELGVAGAKGKAVIDKKEVTVEGEVGAALAHGEVSGSFEFLGANITITGEGEALGVGIGGSFSSTSHSFELGGKLSCLLGGGVKVKVDW